MDDPLASALPPPCNVNYDNFALNGAQEFGVPGLFMIYPDFCADVTPTVARFYLATDCPTVYISSVFTVTPGYDEQTFNTWSCWCCGGPPAAPQHLVIIPIGTSVGLYWNRVSGSGIQYKIYSDSTPDGAFTLLLGTTADTSFVDNTTALKKFYLVRAEQP